MDTQDALALDAQIAKYFFGYTLTDRYPEANGAKWRLDDGNLRVFYPPPPVPRYSTNWNDMALVVEELRKRGWLVKMQAMPGDIPWLANDVDEADLPIYKPAYVSLAYMKGRTSTDPKEARRYIHCHIDALAETLPEAVCRAALDTLTADTG